MQQKFATAMAEGGQYERVGMTRPLKEFSGRTHRPDIVPDVVGLRWDGTIDMIEIASPNQMTTRRLLELNEKLETALGQLPQEMRGSIFVVKHPK